MNNKLPKGVSDGLRPKYYEIKFFSFLSSVGFVIMIFSIFAGSHFKSYIPFLGFACIGFSTFLFGLIANLINRGMNNE